MDIFSYFRKHGIDTVDSSFYRKIEEWRSWYVGNVRNFTRYRVFTGQGEWTPRTRKSLGMAKKLSEDIADLLLNERTGVTLSDAAAQEYVMRVLAQNHFQVLGNEYQERKAYTGTVAYIPYLKDAQTDADGNAVGGTVGMDYVSGQDIYPVSWENGRVTECIFTFPKKSMGKKYVQIQYHHLETDGDGFRQYVIENTVVEAVSGSRDGRELTPEEWRRVKPFANLVPRTETGFDRPQFVLDRLNLVNSYDEDSPMGVAIFADAIDILKKIDLEYDSYCEEFNLGRKRIFVAPDMLHYADGRPMFDPNDTVFYKLPDSYQSSSGETDLIHEVNMDLRAEAHSKAIGDDLNYLSLRTGFGTDHYRFDNTGGVKTATEVISENSDMYRMVKKHEIILAEALEELIRIILRLGTVTGEWSGTVEEAAENGPEEAGNGQNSGAGPTGRGTGGTEGENAAEGKSDAKTGTGAGRSVSGTAGTRAQESGTENRAAGRRTGTGSSASGNTAGGESTGSFLGSRDFGRSLRAPELPEDLVKITIDFDDSIIEDKTAERATDRQDVAMGAMQLWEYRMKWYSETEEQARAAVAGQEELDVME